MSQDNQNDSSQAGATHVDTSDSGTAVDTSLTLTELNQFLGKDFKDKDTALASLKEAQRFVGQRREDIEKEVRASIAKDAASTAPASKPDDSLKSEVQSLKDRLFFSDNPQYKGYEKVIAKMGSNPAEVVESEEFKMIFEKGKVADDVQKTRSVAPSTARIAQTKSAVDEAIKVANATKSAERTAEALAAAVREEYNL